MVKKWNSLHQDDPGLLDPDVSDIELDPSSLPTDPNPEIELSPEEALEQGFYHVRSILTQTFQPAWHFLTHWEGFSISASTWEPIRAFIFTPGSGELQISGILPK